MVLVAAAAAAAAVDGWPAEFLKCHVKLLIHVQAALKVFGSVVILTVSNGRFCLLLFQRRKFLLIKYRI